MIFVIFKRELMLLLLNLSLLHLIMGDSGTTVNCTGNPNATGCISGGFFEYSFAALMMIFALLF
jgi:hypothetical protein